MRNTDDPWGSPMKPLGDRAAPVKPQESEWKPYKDRNGDPVKGVEVNSEGKVRTNIPLPKYPRWFPI